jgi:hypothetical protein
MVPKRVSRAHTHARALSLCCVFALCVCHLAQAVCVVGVCCVCVTFLRDGGAELAVVAEADDTSTIAVRCHFRCCILTAEPLLEVACAITNHSVGCPAV